MTIPETSSTKATGTGSATWDFGDQKGTTPPDFGGAKLAAGAGVSIEVDSNGQTGQAALDSFSWGVSNPAGGSD